MMAAPGEEIRRRRPFAGAAEESLLNLLRTAFVLERRLATFLSPFGVTPKQYNALRILAGSYPEPLSCGEVGSRMVTPVPDVTRLLARLEGQRLVSRRRGARDRRVVAVAITAAGRRLLERIEPELRVWLGEMMGRLGERRLRQLSRLLEALREQPRPGPAAG